MEMEDYINEIESKNINRCNYEIIKQFIPKFDRDFSSISKANNYKKGKKILSIQKREGELYFIKIIKNQENIIENTSFCDFDEEFKELLIDFKNLFEQGYFNEKSKSIFDEINSYIRSEEKSYAV